jgi:hypothetical protein
MQQPIKDNQNNQPYIFPYETYSSWSRQLARTYTVAELQKEVNKYEGLSEKYAKQHLSSIQASTSMNSQSQRKAHARNNVTFNYEKKQAYKNAIELHMYYPEKCKKSLNK